MKFLSLALLSFAAGVVPAAETSATVSGELRTWHKVTLVCPGPATAETATPNPFADYRLSAVFTHPASGKTFTVPGYYAADGNAAETSAKEGNLWHVHFAPEDPGIWTFALSFRTGTGIAVDPNPAAGVSGGFFDGSNGSFEIFPSDKTGSDLRAKGRLEYVGKHHLRFAGTGEWFMKCGTDSPENLLAYADFDDTPNVGGRLKTWSAHAPDLMDPVIAAELGPFTWQNGEGSELLGALRYLAAEGLNSFSFLTFSVDGDDDNVFPHLINGTVSYYQPGPDDERWSRLHHDRFDVSKLAQWERIFSYAATRGMHLHFKTQETENDQRMDGGVLGPERRLYYRELVARFSHHLALNWNLGEENSNSEEQRIAFAQWFQDNDPYRHPVVMHTYDSSQGGYNAMKGPLSKLTGVSLQPNDSSSFSTVFAESRNWVVASAAAGKPWVVACDEPGDSSNGLHLDSIPGDNHANARRNALWANPMAGGAGVEWYFGGGTNDPDTDLETQSFLSRSSFWPICRHMLDFWKISGAPFWEMTNANSLVTGSNNFCLAKAGDCYVIQLKSGGTTSLDLTPYPGTLFSVHWFDPRHGGGLHSPVTAFEIAGGASVSIGSPPSHPTADWMVLVRKITTNTPPGFAGADLSTPHATSVMLSKNKLLAAAFDAEEHPLSVTSTGIYYSARGGKVEIGAGIVYTPAAGFSGKDLFPVTIQDSQQATTTGLITVIVEPPSSGGGAGVNPPEVTLSGGTVMLRFHGIPGVTYTIQRSPDLIFWQTIHTGTADQTSGVLEHSDTSPLSPSGFYRLNLP